MGNLIKVEVNSSQEQVVNGRMLHEFLGVETPYTKWFSRMCEYGFTENQDFVTVGQKCPIANGGYQTKHNHVVKLDMAKELCMLARNDKGKQARQYFIQVEKDWNSPDKVMARALVIANNTIHQLKPKADVYDTFIDKGHAIGFRELAKELKVKESHLRNFLKANNIAYNCQGKWKPYAESIENKYMVVKDVINNTTGYTGTQALFTVEGREYIRKQMSGQGIKVA